MWTPQHPRTLRMNRPEPRMRADEMRTFSIKAPVKTHWREATCEQVRCLHFTAGWRSVIDESTELGQKQAHYIRTASGRGFTESRGADGLTTFEFKPGQKCFRGKHFARDEDIPELLIVRDGDHRGNPRGTSALRCSTDEWINKFGDNQAWLAKRLEGR